MSDPLEISVSHEPHFQLPGSNIVFVGAISPLHEYLLRVARMASAFEEGSGDLRDIRTADVINAISDLYGRAKEFERGCSTLSVRRDGDETKSGSDQ